MNLLSQLRSRLRRDSDFRSESIVGLRGWRVVLVECKPLLCSLTLPFFWMGHEAAKFRELEPDDIFQCDNRGFHAVKTIDDAVKVFKSYRCSMMGEVWLWGRVDEYEYGYMAEFAYPKTLWPAGTMDPLVVMELEEYYGISADWKSEFGEGSRVS